MESFNNAIRTARIIPVAVFDNPAQAVRTAEFLLEHSILVLEVTLRTQAAFDCIQAVADEFPNMVVGAGSVLSVDSAERSVRKGARFCVSPCLDLDVFGLSAALKVPFIPGIATPSEMNAALNAGASLIKIFPAADLGGVNYIKSVCAPFKLSEFAVIPTGGINEKNIAEYFTSDKVIACGLSYVVDKKLVEKNDFETLGNRIANTYKAISL